MPAGRKERVEKGALEALKITDVSTYFGRERWTSFLGATIRLRNSYHVISAPEPGFKWKGESNGSNQSEDVASKRTVVC